MIDLPPWVSVEKRPYPDGGWGYHFRHRGLGELGRVLVRNAPGGRCLLSCEIAGDPADPMTARRAGVFTPVARAIIAELETRPGADGPVLTPWAPDGVGGHGEPA